MNEEKKKKFNEKIIIPLIIIAIVIVVVILIIAIKRADNSVLTKKDNNNSITLDMSNYADYLDISVIYGVDGNPRSLNGYSFYFYPTIIGKATITGASSNFNYNDVEVVVNVFGTYDEYEYSSVRYARGKEKQLDETFTVKCNVGGNGTASFSKNLFYTYTYKKSIKANYRIVSVSGIVTPVK